jgi:hypothetical protein
MPDDRLRMSEFDNDMGKIEAGCVLDFDRSKALRRGQERGSYGPA